MENKYLLKVAEMIRIIEPPRSERAAKRPRRIHKPKLHKFHVNFSQPRHNNKI